jgi:hypothetical protein
MRGEGVNQMNQHNQEALPNTKAPKKKARNIPKRKAFKLASLVLSKVCVVET